MPETKWIVQLPFKGEAKGCVIDGGPMFLGGMSIAEYEAAHGAVELVDGDEFDRLCEKYDE